MKRYGIIGSLNMDMVTRMERFPVPGETLPGLSFSVFPGGKGANQAVALARLGGGVEMVGALGDDLLGDRYRELLSGLAIGTQGVARVPGCSTGTASIEVTSSGENHIVIVGGANNAVTAAYVDRQRSLIESCDWLLLQLEIPLEAVARAAAIAREAGIPTVLDPAPVRDLPAELYANVSIITPNETEAHLLTGEDTRCAEGIQRAGRNLLARGVDQVVIKAGKRGSFLVTREACVQVPSFPVRVVDSVAAGDSFNAGLALALSQGAPMLEALRFANATGALATTREGAQSAMPDLPAVQALIREGRPYS
jgi:ribokinase